MSARVKVPTQLRSLTQGAAEVDASGATVAELLDDLESRHPGIKERVLDESGALRRFLNVYIDDEDVRFIDGISTKVPDGASMSIIPAVAGGGRSDLKGDHAASLAVLRFSRH